MSNEQSPSAPTPDAERTEQIRERERKATKGPWISNCYRQLNSPYWLLAGHIKLGQPENPNRSADIGFAAHARSDIPFLLQALYNSQTECLQAHAVIGTLQSELSRAQANEKRMREALEKIAQGAHVDGVIINGVIENKAVYIAKAALADDTTSPPAHD